MMVWVSISGTALSIFLVMAFIISDNLSTVEVSPESNRGRILSGQGMDESDENTGWTKSSSQLKVEEAERLYMNLDGVERVSFIEGRGEQNEVGVDGGFSDVYVGKKVDDEFWKIYDFRFVAGKPFTKSQVSAGERLVVLTRSLARRLYGKDDVVDREVEIGKVPARVVGVVEDPSPILTSSYANFYEVFDKEDARRKEEDWGSTQVVLLLKEGVPAGHIKSQVESRLKRMSAEREKEGKKLIYHQQPYTAEEVGYGIWSNVDPEVDKHKRVQWAIYALLLLLPAINLSSMTRSRLRHRVSEIGVRRAFGAKRISIIGQMFTENFIITLIGGVIGLVLSLIFLELASEFLFLYVSRWSSTLEMMDASPDLGMLLQWRHFLWALLFCFVLNLLSATVPAWKASRVEPAVALSASR